ncbi:MAG: non-canonical purine NTP pyrophosphatase, partial [Candidatus Gracilibacteria bacterium]
MEPFLIATANLGKFKEIATALESLPYRFLSLKDLGFEGQQVEETGTTHEENARLKAEFFYQKTGVLTLGEDSGLEVEALQGELGLHTRRFGAGEKASDEE